jgi:hypothetical protein
MDSLDDQSHQTFELATSQSHLAANVLGDNHRNSPSSMAADSAYGTSEIAHHQYGTYSSKTSSSRGHVRNDKIWELTGGDAANIDDDV